MAAPLPADNLQGPAAWLRPAQQGYDIGHPRCQHEPPTSRGMATVLPDTGRLDCGCTGGS